MQPAFSFAGQQVVRDFLFSRAEFFHRPIYTKMRCVCFVVEECRDAWSHKHGCAKLKEGFTFPLGLRVQKTTLNSLSYIPIVYCRKTHFNPVLLLVLVSL